MSSVRGGFALILSGILFLYGSARLFQVFRATHVCSFRAFEFFFLVCAGCSVYLYCVKVCSFCCLAFYVLLWCL